MCCSGGGELAYPLAGIGEERTNLAGQRLLDLVDEAVDAVLDARGDRLDPALEGSHPGRPLALCLVEERRDGVDVELRKVELRHLQLGTLELGTLELGTLEL